MGTTITVRINNAAYPVLVQQAQDSGRILAQQGSYLLSQALKLDRYTAQTLPIIPLGRPLRQMTRVFRIHVADETWNKLRERAEESQRYPIQQASLLIEQQIWLEAEKNKQ